VSRIQKSEILFETKDVTGNTVRTSTSYWEKILQLKHAELTTSTKEVISTLQNPEEVRESIQDSHILLFYRRWDNLYLVIVVKYIQTMGFIVTMYKTSKVKRKGTIVWQQKKTT